MYKKDERKSKKGEEVEGVNVEGESEKEKGYSIQCFFVSLSFFLLFLLSSSLLLLI